MTITETRVAGSGLGPDRPRIRAASAGDTAALTRFLEALSPEALQRRFLTGMGLIPPRLVAHLASGGDEGGALLAEVDAVVVGHALWAPVAGQARPTAELALVVADDHRRRGLGTALAVAVLVELDRRGFDLARAVSGADNRPVLRMVRHAPGAATERDGVVCTTDFPVRTALISRVG